MAHKYNITGEQRHYRIFDDAVAYQKSGKKSVKISTTLKSFKWKHKRQRAGSADNSSEKATLSGTQSSTADITINESNIMIDIMYWI